MATVNATVRRNLNNDVGKGLANALIDPGHRTIELAASASGTIIDFKLRIPSVARISALSRLFHDDLATSGSPTLDLGLYAVDGNITSDDDCLTDGVVVSAVMTSSTQTIGVPVVKDFANAGKQAWEFVNGQTSDPGGFFDVKGIIRDAATNATGTVGLAMVLYFD